MSDLPGTGQVSDLMSAFAEAVREYPDRPAIVHDGQPLSSAAVDLLVRCRRASDVDRTVATELRDHRAVAGSRHTVTS